LGGYQTEPFVLLPAEWKVEEGQLVGAAAVYKQFKDWLGEVQGQGRDEAKSTQRSGARKEMTKQGNWLWSPSGGCTVKCGEE
jgi:hypothetical protein